MTSTLRLLLVLVALASSQFARASIVGVFTNRPLWEAAVTGAITTETLDAVAVGSLAGSGTTGPYSIPLGVITFEFPHALGSEPRIVSNISGRNLDTVVGEDTTTGSFPGNYPEYNNIVLPAPATAFGADFFSASSAGELVFNIDGEIIELASYLSYPGNGFFGFISNVAFTTVNITVGDTEYPAELYSIDNISFNTAPAPVPEPGAYVVLSAGLALLAVRFRRRRRV